MLKISSFVKNGAVLRAVVSPKDEIQYGLFVLSIIINNWSASYENFQHFVHNCRDSYDLLCH